MEDIDSSFGCAQDFAMLRFRNVLTFIDYGLLLSLYKIGIEFGDRGYQQLGILVKKIGRKVRKKRCLTPLIITNVQNTQQNINYD